MATMDIPRTQWPTCILDCPRTTIIHPLPRPPQLARPSPTMTNNSSHQHPNPLLTSSKSIFRRRSTSGDRIIWRWQSWSRNCWPLCRQRTRCNSWLESWSLSTRSGTTPKRRSRCESTSWAVPRDHRKEMPSIVYRLPCLDQLTYIHTWISQKTFSSSRNSILLLFHRLINSMMMYFNL